MRAIAVLVSQCVLVCALSYLFVLINASQFSRLQQGNYLCDKTGFEPLP